MNSNVNQKPQKYYIEDIEVGQKVKFFKTFHQEDVEKFSEISGDNNPVHLDANYASKTIFKKRVVHGFLTGSLISTVIASKLPGPGSIYLKQELKFLSPVFIGEIVKAEVTILEINSEKKKILLLTECFVLEKKVLTGKAEILVSSKPKL